MRLLLLAALMCGCGDDVMSQSPDGSAGSGGTGGSAGSGGSGGSGGSMPDGPPASTNCDPLAAPSGTVIDVTPADTANLGSIVAGAADGTTIRFASGTYATVPRLNIGTRITLRSASGNAADVILDGMYQTDEIVVVNASNVTVADLTITHAINHLVHAYPPDTADVTGTRLYRLRLIDGGEQFVKVNQNAARTHTVDDGVLACSLLQMTDAGRPHVVSVPGSPCYTGGIDGHGAAGWTVQRNQFDGIWCATGLAEHAVHFWDASSNTLVEQNVIHECARGVGFGLGTADPGETGGIIRNNLITANISGFDTGIGLEQAHMVRVYHNTVFATTSFSSIDYRFSGTSAEIRNNLVQIITQRDGATGTVDHNVQNVAAADFVSATDFHLSASATDAIDQGITVSEAGLDLDGHPHTNGPPDLGCYER